ncbi:MAG: hypothetical protein QOJ13_806 [Gaiellales bacterium]|jgi:hypothetical protein|nr:hypothetical protein [Gaiellales bacterium]
MSPDMSWDTETLRLACIRGEAPATDKLPPPMADTIGGLLDRTLSFLKRYLVLGDDEAVTVCLWIAHTHAFDAADITPYLWVSSAERESGKSLLLDFLEVMASNPWRAVTPSEAVTFRKIEADAPTLLLDEVDAIFSNSHVAAQHEGLRALLNAGFRRRGSTIPRCIGDRTIKVQDFNTFCPKAIAGIGRLPDTVASRSIRIRLQRKLKRDHVERWRERQVPAAAVPLQAALAHHLDLAVPAIERADVKLPDELNDRAQDAWEPLLAVASVAGGEWPSRARAAALALTATASDEDESPGKVLLTDLRRVFDEAGDPERLSTQELISKLTDDPNSPWQEWRNAQPLTPRQLAKLLRPYGLSSEKMRFDEKTLQGWHRGPLVDAWERWAPLSQISTTTTTSTTNGHVVVDVVDFQGVPQ